MSGLSLPLRKTWVVLGSIALLLGIAGCENRSELETGLDARESIDMVVALNKSGISADREQTSAGRDAKYRVTVNPRDRSRAFGILSEFGLPKKSGSSVDACMQPQGFAPSPPEMVGLRLDRALELRIEQLLSGLPDVISATVVIRSNLASSYMASAGQDLSSAAAHESRAPTASVIVRYASSDPDAPFDTANIKQIVAQAVPGLSAETVSVQATRSPLELKLGQAGSFGGLELVQLPLFNFRVPREDRVVAGWNILIVVVCICFAGLVIGMALSARNFRKRLMMTRARTASGEHPRSLFIEAQMNQQQVGPPDGTRGKLPPVRQMGQNE